MVDGMVGGPKTCSGLSDRGRAQAERLGARFASGSENSIEIAYTSPLPRAVETTEIVLSSGSLNLDINVHVDLEEFRLGEADGLTWEEVRTKYDLSNISRNKTNSEINKRLNRLISRNDAQKYIINNWRKGAYMGDAGKITKESTQ